MEVHIDNMPYATRFFQHYCQPLEGEAVEVISLGQNKIHKHAEQSIKDQAVESFNMEGYLE